MWAQEEGPCYTVPGVYVPQRGHGGAYRERERQGERLRSEVAITERSCLSLKVPLSSRGGGRKGPTSVLRHPRRLRITTLQEVENGLGDSDLLSKLKSTSLTMSCRLWNYK